MNISRMKNVLRRTLPLFIVLGLAAVFVTAQTTLSSTGQVLTGSWTGAIMPPGNAPAVPLMITYFEDGSVLATPGTPTLSDGHGTWVRTGDRQFAQTEMHFIYSAQGAYMGVRKLLITAQLNDTLDQVSGNVEAIVTDASGNLVSDTTGITYNASRIAVQLSQ